MPLTRKQAIELLVQNPYLIGRAVGFTRLTGLHNEWIKAMVFGDGDMTLQAHRGSYKTTCISIALAIILVLYPNDRTMFMRKTDSDVKEVLMQVQKIIQHPIMKALSFAIWGIAVDITRASTTEIKINLCNDIKGTLPLVGIGTSSSLTGKHFDRIFTDDIVNIKDRVSPAERQRVILIYQELQNIRNRGGRIFNSGTPWHKDDCFSIMPPAMKYDCYSTGILTGGDIEQIKDSMTASLFAANYELRHIAAEDVIFTNPQTGADESVLMQALFCHVDAAYGGEDSTAFTIAKKWNGKYYVLGKLWHRHVEDVEPEIIKLYERFCVRTLYCEENADKGYLKKELRKQGVRTCGYYESTNKFIKIVSYLKAEWKDVVFVNGTDQAYIDEVCEYSELAEHDDAPDSLASAIRLLWPRKDQFGRPVATL